MKTLGCLYNLFLLAIIIAGLWVIVSGVGWTLFEDGSFILGAVRGCLPWGLCALP